MTVITDGKLAPAQREPAFQRFGLRLGRLVDALGSSRPVRIATLTTVEVLTAIASILGAVALVYSGEFWRWPVAVWWVIALISVLHLLLGTWTGAVRTRWRFVGLHDAMVIARACLASSLGAALIVSMMDLHTTLLRLVAAYAMLYFALAAGSRLLVRSLHEWGRKVKAAGERVSRRAVIVGAGVAGGQLIKTLLSSPKQLIDPVAVVDDDPGNHGKLLHGVPIAGDVDELLEICLLYRAEEVLIAIPSASADQMRRIVDCCLKARRPFRIAPDAANELDGARPSPLRVMQLSDLLGRPQVNLNLAQMRAELQGARVIITGAAGSIGSELVHQLAKLQPAHLYLVDRNENDMYYLRTDLEARGSGVPYTVIIDDIRNEARLQRLMLKARPTHVFHAAAFKHVPLMEMHPLSAVENNILGTWSVLDAAAAAGVRKFVLISTDKAVEPSSVMGATKRFAEMLVTECTGTSSMVGVIVRFGNVLGSNGSVVPLFQRQIATGGPITITSREATRYFMTTAEAAQLVLQATSLKETAGKIAILDMGTPVRIAELAERLIMLSGLRPGVDIEILETGLRPGEKLHERLWWESETASPSAHPKISLAPAVPLPVVTGQNLGRMLADIAAMVEREDRAGLRAMLERTTGLSAENGDAEHGVDPASVELVAAAERASSPHRHGKGREAPHLAQTG